MAADIELAITGPIELGCDDLDNKRKFVQPKHRAAFWRQTEAVSISKKQGIYLFALANTQGFRIFYVGQTSRSFKAESLSERNLNLYNSLLTGTGRGKPVLFFLHKPGGGSGKMDRKKLDEIEKELIANAAARTKDILNTKHKKTWNWSIPGVTKPKQGRSTKEQKQLRAMLGF